MTNHTVVCETQKVEGVEVSRRRKIQRRLLRWRRSNSNGLVMTNDDVRRRRRSGWAMTSWHIMVFSSTLIHAHPAIHPSIFFLISNSQFIHSHDYIIRLIHSSSKLITPHYLSSTRRSRSLNAKLSGTFSLNFFFFGILQILRIFSTRGIFWIFFFLRTAGVGDA